MRAPEASGQHLLVKANAASGTRRATVFTSNLLGRIFSAPSLAELVAVYPTVEAVPEAF